MAQAPEPNREGLAADEFHVVQILDHRADIHGVVWYLVEWECFPGHLSCLHLSFDSWVLLEDMNGSPVLILDYLKKLRDRKLEKKLTKLRELRGNQASELSKYFHLD